MYQASDDPQRAFPSDPLGSPTAPVDAASLERTSRQERDARSARAPDYAVSLLGMITRAMRAAAAKERDRLLARAAADADAHERKVRERGALEAAELQRLSRRELDEVRRWSESEMQRIRNETQARLSSERERLGQASDSHQAIIETEIGRVRAAVDIYRFELDEFFESLARKTNPSDIARLAGALPGPPNLDGVGASARVAAVAAILRGEEAVNDATDTAPRI
jgi:hypothetical protein